MAAIYQAERAKPAEKAQVPKWGFPAPGAQRPRVEDVVNNTIFMSDAKWSSLPSLDEYDFVVVGTGCTALAFIDEALRLDPYKRILCVERGGFLLPTHFQNLSAPFKALIGGDSETFPWTLSEETHQSNLGYCHGYYPFFGGRSLFWSGWCPEPSLRALRDFPASTKLAAADPDFWNRGRQVLNVVSTAEIEDEAFGPLQGQLNARLKAPFKEIPSLAVSEPAMLAGGHRHKKAKTGFSKFCAAESLLALVHRQKLKAAQGEGSPLDIRLNCATESLVMDGENVAGLETSQGTLRLREDRTKLILCAGAIPNTTILYNSIPRIRNTAGKRLTGHFLSHITVRVPKEKLTYWTEHRGNSLEIAAQCLLGYHPVTQRQYQIQITAVHCPEPERDVEDLAKKCPDFSASAQTNQLIGSEGHVLFMCAAIGEFSEHNQQCWVQPEENDPDKTTNIRLQYLCDQDDEDLWTYMEQTTFQVVDQLTKSEPKEYWNKYLQGWSTKRPDEKQMRIKGVVHEASSTFMGPESEGGSVNEMYQPYGANNVYVTGAGIFPTAGAWNPTLPMCALAQDLARKLDNETRTVTSPSSEGSS